MFDYYLSLAFRSFRRNKVLTALMVLALGLGIGASMTTLTVLKLLSGDPLPTKSARLFVPEIDPLPATSHMPVARVWTHFGSMLSYVDAMNLLRAHQARRQAVMALAEAKVAPRRAGARPFFSDAVMTTAGFFRMFDVPFRYGGGWGANADRDRARVVVIAGFLNRKLFGGRDSVGRTIRVNNHDYRVVGVLRPWSPQPRFYAANLGGNDYGRGDAVFLPLQSARADGMTPESENCWRTGDLQRLETAPCEWVSLWVEVANATAARSYRTFLSNYVAQQIALGRLHQSEVGFPDLMQDLAQQGVVPGTARMETWLAFGFLLICVVGTVGLLLAKCLGRTGEIAVRRALGATRGSIFEQFMVESGMVGVAGGLLGLGFAELGLWEVRQEPARYAHFAHLDPTMFVATFAIALIASLIAGLLPAWRACSVVPAPHLKSV